MNEQAKPQWADASGKEIAAGVQVALIAKVVGRHGGGRVSVEPLPGQRIIVPGKMCDQGKATGKRALQEALALVGAREKELAACHKEKESFKEQLARVQSQLEALQGAKPKGG